MQQIKTHKSALRIFILLIFVGLFFISRVPRLGNDEANPDGVNWHYRSQQFVVGLKTGQLEKTYQHYHPGVILMWVTGIPVELFKQFTGITTYDQYNFEAFNFVAKFSLITVQLILSILIIYLLAKIIGFYKSFLVVGFLSFEPFFLGNSRIYHMDVLFALLLIVALLYSYLAIEKRKVLYTILAGLFLCWSFLTKSIGIGALAFVFGSSLVFFAVKKDIKYYLKYGGILLAVFIVSTFIFFPAMFKGPVYYLGQIFSESARIGLRNGHAQIVLGSDEVIAGFNFYPLVLALKISPFVWVGVLLFLVFLIKKEKVSIFTISLTIFYLGYLAVLSVSPKKIDRYMIPMFPYFAYLAVLGYYRLFEMNKGKKIRVGVLLSSFSLFAFVTIALPDVKLFPYLFTYSSPLFGSPENANKIIGQKPFGMGIFDLKAVILQKYGNYPKLGFYDTKPMQAIYPNSKIFDIRTNGPGSYSLIILGINEEMPERIIDQDIFEKDSSVYINGLEYWRIYAKKDR